MCTGVHERGSFCTTQSSVVWEPRRIWGPRLLPAQQKCSAELVGLGIVAAIQVELDTATSYGTANQQMPRHPAMPAHKPRHLTTPANQHNGPTSASQQMPCHPTTSASQQTPRHCVRLQEKSKSPSIFTISSPSCMNTSSTHFSTSCFLCKRPLPSGKDVYMYRGDQAFCTKQCRHHQMAIDESKEKLRLHAPTFTATKCHVDSCTTAPNYYKQKEKIFAYV